MKSHCQTESSAPMYLVSIPDPKHERNLLEIGKIPYVLSLLATHSPTGVVQGLKDFPKDERPNVWLAYFPFRIMVGLAGFFVIMAVVGWFKRNKLESSPGYLKIMLGVALVFLPIVILYQAWVYVLFKGKVSEEDLAHQEAY